VLRRKGLSGKGLSGWMSGGCPGDVRGMSGWVSGDRGGDPMAVRCEKYRENEGGYPPSACVKSGVKRFLD